MSDAVDAWKSFLGDVATATNRTATALERITTAMAMTREGN